MDINDGGFAFPLKEPLSSDAYGMTLRDYFAAQVVSAVYQTDFLHEGRSLYCQKEWQMRIAFNAYQVADAMLKVREMKL